MRQPFSDVHPEKILESNGSFSGFDSMDVCMVGVMADGHIFYVNQPACDLIGCFPKRIDRCSNPECGSGDDPSGVGRLVVGS